MPVLFSTSDESIRDLEKRANIAEDSISHVSWIKNPDHRSKDQQYTNLKIYCKTAETANKLIMYWLLVDGGRRIECDISTQTTTMDGRARTSSGLSQSFFSLTLHSFSLSLSHLCTNCSSSSSYFPMLLV